MIDENKLKEQLFALVEQIGDERLHIDAVVQLIDDAQTVDAVEVVRCRDCMWWHDWNGECYAKEAQGFGHLWEANDYCSYGLRKDGDGNG